MRFLISRLSAMGDVVCTSPAAALLRRTFPESRIEWIVDKRFAGIVECVPSVDQIHIAPKKIKDYKPFWKQLGEFDVAFDLQGLAKSGLAMAGVKAERKLGFHWQREGAALFSQPIKPDPTSHHVVDQYVDVVRSICVETHEAVFDLTPHPYDLQRFREEVDEDRPLVLFTPGAGWATKRWPPSHFVQLAQDLLNRDIQVGFLGAPSEKEAFRDIKAELANQVHDWVGRTSVKELVALISLASAHVGGDTGNSHIAAALGIPAIGLYSITPPERSCPYGMREYCLYNPISLAEIKPDEALQMVELALTHRPATAG